MTIRGLSVNGGWEKLKIIQKKLMKIKNTNNFYGENKSNFCKGQNFNKKIDLIFPSGFLH